ncbi:MAG TPA: MFS transporter [Candidatus Dormibacteraeota bacterium]|nr:MFS transporter [Candidatus Dormibacteraeota bacterium]
MGNRASASDSYKWIALSNTTLAVLLATLDVSITIIAMPDIFRGIHLDPLQASNSFYLLWMILGYMIVGSVLIVSLGRLGDMFGRVRIYNLGFVVYTVASLLLTVDWLTGRAGADYLIVLRIFQGIGGACLMANAAAIITDAFPENQRGMALGINNIVGVSGMFIGLVLGGLLAPVNWRLVFLISVPVGLFGTVWAYLKLEELGEPRRRPIDWWGNLTFAVGLVCLMVAVTYGIRPYGSHATGWMSPRVIGLLAAGIGCLTTFVVIERHVSDPMFRLPLFRIRAFTFGTASTFLSAVARGGLMFMLIIWLQGIWLPLHGFSFEVTPLWAAIYMLPMTAGFLIAGPISGYLSDRFGARPFATGGMLAAALTFGLMLLLPADFSYPPFAALLLANGLAMGLFASPNTAGIMNAVPPHERGVASGMRSTFQNAGMNLSIGLFFSLMIAGLSADLPRALYRGLTAQGLPATVAARIAHLPPVGVLFAAFLGFNPMRALAGPALARLPVEKQALITGKAFFPQLISGPFMDGVHLTFAFSMVMMLVAAAASWLRGGRYVYGEEVVPAPAGAPVPLPARSGAPAGPSLVAVSAAYGAGGGEIGQALARRLGVPFIDRALPAGLAERLSAPLQEALEDDVRPANGRVARALAEVGASSPLFGIQGLSASPAVVDAEGYRARVVEALDHLAGSSGGVVVGHGAAAALLSRPHVLRVRLEGPPARRLHRAMRMEGLEEAAAKRRLAAADRAHRAYLRYLFGREPEDRELYHLILDSTVLSPEACVEVILTALEGLRGADLDPGPGR